MRNSYSNMQEPNFRVSESLSVTVPARAGRGRARRRGSCAQAQDAHMGCSASKKPPEAAVDIDHSPHVKLEKRRKNSVHYISPTEADAVRNIFTNYQSEVRKSKAYPTEGSRNSASERISARGDTRKVITQDGLREILKDVNENLFKFLWRLFDVGGTGFVDADEFVMAMALLSAGIGESAEAQLEAAFCMFDSDKSGSLTREDFESMIQATCALQTPAVPLSEPSDTPVASGQYTCTRHALMCSSVDVCAVRHARPCSRSRPCHQSAETPGVMPYMSRVNLNLDHLLETDHGAAAFEAQLQREFSEENLAFWQVRTRAYAQQDRDVTTGRSRLAAQRESGRACAVAWSRNQCGVAR